MLSDRDWLLAYKDRKPKYTTYEFSGKLIVCTLGEGTKCRDRYGRLDIEIAESFELDVNRSDWLIAALEGVYHIKRVIGIDMYVFVLSPLYELIEEVMKPLTPFEEFLVKFEELCRTYDVELMTSARIDDQGLMVSVRGVESFWVQIPSESKGEDIARRLRTATEDEEL